MTGQIVLTAALYLVAALLAWYEFRLVWRECHSPRTPRRRTRESGAPRGAASTAASDRERTAPPGRSVPRGGDAAIGGTRSTSVVRSSHTKARRPVGHVEFSSTS